MRWYIRRVLEEKNLQLLFFSPPVQHLAVRKGRKMETLKNIWLFNNNNLFDAKHAILAYIMIEKFNKKCLGCAEQKINPSK